MSLFKTNLTGVPSLTSPPPSLLFFRTPFYFAPLPTVWTPGTGATNSTGIRANWINCLLYFLKVLLNLHNFPLLNINCTEPYLGPLYRSYIMVQILNCKIPERVLLNGAIWKRFSKVSRRWRCAACHLLQVFTFKYLLVLSKLPWSWVLPLPNFVARLEACPKWCQ